MFWILWTWECRYFFETLTLNLLDIYSEVGLLDMFILFFNFLRNYSIATAAFYIPPNMYKDSSFSPSLPTLTFCLFFFFFRAAILTGLRGGLIVVLICVSLIICDVESLFMCLLSVSVSSLGKCLFLNQIEFFLLLSYRSSWYILDQSMIKYRVCNYYLHSAGYIFLLLVVYFAAWKLFSLM